MAKKCLEDIYDDVKEKIRKGYTIETKDLEFIKNLMAASDMTTEEHDKAIIIEAEFMKPPIKKYFSDEEDIPEYVKKQHDTKKVIPKVNKKPSQTKISNDELSAIENHNKTSIKLKEEIVVALSEPKQEKGTVLYQLDGKIEVRNNEVYVICQNIQEMFSYFEGKQIKITVLEV